MKTNSKLWTAVKPINATESPRLFKFSDLFQKLHDNALSLKSSI